MINLRANVWDVRDHDGRSREHVPDQPVWSAIGMRILQLVLAFIILVMTAYAASQLGSDIAGFGLAWFTFILTFGSIIYLGVSLFTAPHMYNFWAQLVLESLLVIFWLCTWAVLASEAADLSPFTDYYSYYRGNWDSAVNCVTASAVLGAILWVTFVITFVFFFMALLRHRKTAAARTGPVTDKPIADGPVPVEMQNQNQAQQPAYPPQPYQAPHQDSPYETQQAYPAGEQQQAPYPVEQPQLAYAVPENREPHQQV